MPLLLLEDAALKAKLQGLTVNDATAGPGGRKVVVRYKNPEYELADAVYPLILISHTRIGKAEEREHRGFVQINYAPEGYPGWDDMMDPSKSPYWSEVPIPLDIEYQIDVYARKETHLIELTGKMLQFDYIPHRLGYLAVDVDGTVRRLDVLGGPDYYESKDELGKRLFGMSWAIRVSSEIFLSELITMKPAERILIDWLDKSFWDKGYVVPLDETQVVTRTKMLIPEVTLPAGKVGVPYRVGLPVMGGVAPFRWSLDVRWSLPEGLALADDGFLFGTPRRATNIPSPAFQVLVRDSDHTPQIADAVLSLAVLPALSGS
jgi:hypothetical protein